MMKNDRRIDVTTFPVQLQELLTKLADKSERADIRLNYANRLDDMRLTIEVAIDKFKRENRY